MKKIIPYLVLILILSIGVNALDECPPITFPREARQCLVTSTWEYPPPCTDHQATVYNSSGDFIENFTYGDFGTTGFCSFTWNLSAIGSYYYEVTNGDTGNIVVERGTMLDIVIGLIAAMVLFGTLGFFVKGLAVKVFAYGVSLVQLVNIMFVLYLNETGGSLINTLRLNFYISLILAFGIGMTSIIILLMRVMNFNDSMEDDSTKWEEK